VYRATNCTSVFLAGMFLFVYSDVQCDQHNKRGDASVRLVVTTNPQQIEVMEFALVFAENGFVAGNGDVFGEYSRQCSDVTGKIHRRCLFSFLIMAA